MATTDDFEEAARFIQAANDSADNYYICRLPGEGPVTEHGASPRLLDGLHGEGFAVCDFENTTPVTIPRDTAMPTPGTTPHTATDFNPLSTTPQQHRDEIEDIQRTLARNGGGKTVAARLLRLDRRPDTAASFAALCRAYPHACVFLFHTHRHGTWLGASPETLLRGDRREIRTMALAGTRPAPHHTPKDYPLHFDAPEWDAKNTDEQQMVTDYIASVLSRHRMWPRVSWRFTRTAGPVEHCCTSITASRPASLRLADLLRDLSPTPALCGSDRESSLQMIRRHEPQGRGCYGGYFGPLRADGSFSLFVNLRSCRLDGTAPCLYAGGGITTASDPDDEWRETERKLSTLLSRLAFR